MLAIVKNADTFYVIFLLDAGLGRRWLLATGRHLWGVRAGTSGVERGGRLVGRVGFEPTTKGL